MRFGNLQLTLSGLTYRQHGFLLLMLLLATSAQAQQAQPSATPQAKVYTYVEQMPEAPEGGGMAGLAAYFWKNLHLSATDIQEMTGRVHVQFIITKKGAVADARIVKSGGSGIDAAALRAVRGMRDLRPGRQHGVPVDVSITLPIVCIKPQ